MTWENTSGLNDAFVHFGEVFGITVFIHRTETTGFDTDSSDRSNQG
ncbi:MAG: hypothetical protein F6K56_15720 [Moorea sp. SIO3G5]|nr:hypothetical protein [Moorena sp. SIO3G5]